MQYDFTLTANGGQRLEVAGRFFKYKSGSGAIRITTDKGGSIDLLPGQGVYGVDFTSLAVADRSGQPNVGIVLAGLYDFRDEQIPGTVKTINDGKMFTMANAAFIGTSEFVNGATSGAVQGIALTNPAGSGKNAVLKALAWNLTYGQDIWVIAGTNINAASVATKAKSKLIGGVNSVCGYGQEQYNTGATMTNLIATGGVMFYTKCPNAVLQQLELREPIVIPPGKAIFLFFSKIADGTGQASMEWTEEAI